MTAPTQAEIDQTKDMAAQVAASIMASVTPFIIEVVAANKSGIKYTRVGDQCVIEPVDPLAGLDLTASTLTVGEEFQPVRDYRKQLWIEIFTSVYDGCPNPDFAEEKANDALARFSKAFPK